VAWKIEAEKSFGAKSEVSPEINSRNQWSGRLGATSLALQVRCRWHEGWREKAIENVGGNIGQRTRGRSTESRVGGMLEAAGDNFS
jgi:hypothetical protein